MSDHINSWRDGQTIAQKQIQQAVLELGGRTEYPHHWQVFLSSMKKVLTADTKRPLNILDIGCGSGIHYVLCQRHFPGEIRYIGCDYSENAVNLAAQQWGGQYFQADYKSLSKDTVDNADIVLACSLTNVLPDGDDCIKHLLSLGAQYVILNKVLITDDSSNYSTYTAYDEIETYKFYHNLEGLMNMFRDYGYEGSIDQSDSDNRNFLLIKHEN
tara:strand:- start:172 stop:813 length:642 start_codon:yes stop_codon:yes gene_type:complete